MLRLERACGRPCVLLQGFKKPRVRLVAAFRHCVQGVCNCLVFKVLNVLEPRLDSSSACSARSTTPWGTLSRRIRSLRNAVATSVIDSAARRPHPFLRLTVCTAQTPGPRTRRTTNVITEPHPLFCSTPHRRPRPTDLTRIDVAASSFFEKARLAPVTVRINGERAIKRSTTGSADAGCCGLRSSHGRQRLGPYLAHCLALLVPLCLRRLPRTHPCPSPCSPFRQNYCMANCSKPIANRL